MKYGLLDTTPERLTKSLNELQRKQQLDYIGTYNATDKVITFETNVDYALENNVEYEIDAILDLSSIIPDDATILFKNNGDDIQVNNLLNYVTVDPITFGQMKQVMLPYDLEEGRYRWIFDATYNLVTGPLPWIVGTEWTYGSGFVNNTSENIGFVLGQQYRFNVTLTFDRQEVDLDPMPVTVIGTAVPLGDEIGVSISPTIPVEYDGRTEEFKFDLLAEDGVMFVDGNPVFNPAYSTALILLGERLAGATITGMSGRRLNDVRVFNMPATVVQDRKDVVQIVTNAEMLNAVTNQLWEGSLIVTPSDDDGYTLGANYQWDKANSTWVELTSPPPASLPQTAGVLKSGNLPTSGWTSTIVPIFDNVLLSATYSQLAKSNGIILPPSNYTAHTAISDWVGTRVYTYPLRSTTLGTDSDGQYIQLIYNLSDTTGYYRIYVYDSGLVKAWNYSDYTTQFSAVICANWLGSYILGISDSDILENSDVLMEITDAGGIKAYSQAVGSITVIRDTVPVATVQIPYTYKVKQTSGAGQFTLINHYIPEIPEIPDIPDVSDKPSWHILFDSADNTANTVSLSEIIRDDLDYLYKIRFVLTDETRHEVLVNFEQVSGATGGTFSGVVCKPVSGEDTMPKITAFTGTYDGSTLTGDLIHVITFTATGVSTQTLSMQELCIIKKVSVLRPEL